MKAIELDAEITADHAIYLKFPKDVLYEADEDTQVESKRGQGNLDDFLTTLPANKPGRDREEIAAQVEAERAQWD